jgi:hypothetical protein
VRKTSWAAAAVAVLLAAGCGGSGDDADGVATLTGAGDGEQTTTTTIPPDEAMLKFVRCMRENGIDMPDPDDQGRVMIRREESGAGSATAGPEDPEFREAEEGCREQSGMDEAIVGERP